MACPPLVISQQGMSLTFTPRHAEDIKQTVTSIGNDFHARAATNGDLIVQTLGWQKYRVQINGSGELPNGLLKIDFSEDFDIYTSISNLTGGAIPRHGTIFSWSEVNGVFVPGGGQESSNYLKLSVHAISHSVSSESGGVTGFSIDAEEV